MEPKPGLILCTFEVATHLGRHLRLGESRDGRVIDLNFATAWYMAQTGEAEPQRLADGLVPSDLREFLRTGLRALHTAEELFLGAGPQPPDWWRQGAPPRGPNQETLVYLKKEVTVHELFGGLADVRGPCQCEWELAAVMGRGGVAGYTLQNHFPGRTAIGPLLLTMAKVPDPAQVEIILRINGEERGRRPALAAFELERPDLPGQVIGGGPLGSASLRPGDFVELEAAGFGVLAHRVV